MADYPKTADYLTNLYITLAKSVSSSVDVSQYTDFNNKAKVLAGIVAGAELDAYNQYIQTIPQYADETGVNLQLAVRGAPTTLPATQATIVCNVLSANITPTPPSLVTINFNINSTYSVSSENKTKYKVTLVNGVSSTTITYPTSTTLNFICTSFGSSNVPDNSAVLPFSVPIQGVGSDSITYYLNSVTLVSGVDGIDKELPSDAQARLLNLYRSPPAGVRNNDYINIVLSANIPTVSSVFVLNANNTNILNSDANVSIFPLSGGSEVSDNLLNMGLLTNTTIQPYTRTANSSAKTSITTLLKGQDFINVFPIVLDVSTIGLVANTNVPTVTGSPVAGFQISVELEVGYTLQSVINIINNDGTSYNLTITQLIQREVRRAICNTTLGADLTINPNTSTYTNSKFPISIIEQNLDDKLGSSSRAGTLGSFLRSRRVYVTTSSGQTSTSAYQQYLYFPDLGIPTSSTDTLKWVYDIADSGSLNYNLITVIDSSSAGGASSNEIL